MIRRASSAQSAYQGVQRGRDQVHVVRQELRHLRGRLRRQRDAALDVAQERHVRMAHCDRAGPARRGQREPAALADAAHRDRGAPVSSLAASTASTASVNSRV